MISTESKSKLQRLTMKNNSIHQTSIWDPERGQVWNDNINDIVVDNMTMIRDIDQECTKCSEVGIIFNAEPVISRLESEESLVRSTTKSIDNNDNNKKKEEQFIYWKLPPPLDPTNNLPPGGRWGKHRVYGIKSYLPNLFANCIAVCCCPIPSLNVPVVEISQLDENDVYELSGEVSSRRCSFVYQYDKNI